MNIGQAKEYIKDSVKIYLKKDEFGEYRIPVVRQRPIFLLGAPGLGKTAIMEQIAQELGVALVSYSMTHHTRQSALGLPYIEKKQYGEKQVDVSEYTMSEIIASIYDVMEQSGMKEGILFLDEINCVSETLAPSMLQFLQYKVFGRHQVPDGWVIVTAGNPPEYNKSVREFDVVTMDRLKVMEVEADYKAWHEYAVHKGLHQAILNYLEMNKDDFYQIEMTAKGRSYVTARGWEDLAAILTLYEEEQLKVDETLIGQYLLNERIVKEFAAYYDLYNKYKKIYPVEEILSGKASEQMIEKASNAGFEERLSLLGMLQDKIQSEMSEIIKRSDLYLELMPMLKGIKLQAENEAKIDKIFGILEAGMVAQEKKIASLSSANTLSEQEKRKIRMVRLFFEDMIKILRVEQLNDAQKAFEIIKEAFDTRVQKLRLDTSKVQSRLHELFVFVEKAFEDGNEMLLLLTSLTVGDESARFITTFDCEDYQRHNEKLMLSERKNDMIEKINALDI